MFGWGKKKGEEILNVSNAKREYEVIAIIDYDDSYIFDRIGLEIKYRLKGTTGYYKSSYKAVICSEAHTSHSNFIVKGHEFMDNIEENITKHAIAAIKSDKEKSTQEYEKAELKERIKSKKSYEITVQVD